MGRKFHLASENKRKCPHGAAIPKVILQRGFETATVKVPKSDKRRRRRKKRVAIVDPLAKFWLILLTKTEKKNNQFMDM